MQHGRTSRGLPSGLVSGLWSVAIAVGREWSTPITTRLIRPPWSLLTTVDVRLDEGCTLNAPERAAASKIYFVSVSPSKLVCWNTNPICDAKAQPELEISGIWLCGT